jgi:hypothetical protein
MMLRVLLALPLLALCFLTPAPTRAETLASERVALVIGMSAYGAIPALKNTVNDARALGETLDGMGFDVEVLVDASRDETLQALSDFTFKAETADQAIIYYAGHGVSVQGTTFLIPVDAQVQAAKDIVTAAVTMDEMLAAVDGARRVGILILDSCRDNPFPDLIDLRDPEVIKGLTTGKGGLAAPSPERGTLVAFAAREGAVALDGTGDNSPFNIALRDNIVQDGLEISLMFRQVREDVLAATNNAQEPATYDSLPSEPFFLARTKGDLPAQGVADLAAAWARIVEVDDGALQQLADAGDTRSIVGLALAKLDRQSPAYDPVDAVALLEKAIAADDADAKFRLAKVYEIGLGVEADPARAIALYTEAAAAGIPGAVNDMGYFHFTGEMDVEKDRAKALDLFRQAADLGHTEAMFNLASFAANGQAPGLGPKDAADLLYRALRGGSELALDGLLNNTDRFPQDTWAALQAILAGKGLYDGAVDGSFGPGTRRAVLAAFGIFEAED